MDGTRESTGRRGSEEHIQLSDDTSDGFSTPPMKSYKGGARNLASFWTFGVISNIGYIIMLSAAHDILQITPGTSQQIVNNTNSSGTTHLITSCNPISTGAVLLAAILPSFTLKLLFPWCIQSIQYTVRIFIVAILSLVSYSILGLSSIIWLSLLGVVLTGGAVGIGELTFVPLTSFFHKNTVSTWSSGTGASGIIGTAAYAVCTSMGLKFKLFMLLMLALPVVLIIIYFGVLNRPKQTYYGYKSLEEERSIIEAFQAPTRMSSQSLGFRDKIKILRKLLKYLIPYALVFLAEYFINLTLFELIEFKDSWISLPAQYRWYIVVYQIGVTISRSSVNFVRIKITWILTLLQFLNVGIFLLQVFTGFLPSIWLVFILILYEGLLGGSLYVNTLYSITEELPDDELEFSLGVVTMGDAIGISIAGLISIPIHDLICSL